MAKANSELSYEQISERLETIANELEKGETKLEQALALFEEGVRLSKLGTERLDKAEGRIERLLEDGSAASLDPETVDPSD